MTGIIDYLSERFDILLIKLDANVKFPMTLWYRRHKLALMIATAFTVGVVAGSGMGYGVGISMVGGDEL